MTISATQLDSAIAKLKNELSITNPRAGLNFHLLLELYLINSEARKEINRIVWTHIDDDIPRPLEVA